MKDGSKRNGRKDLTAALLLEYCRQLCQKVWGDLPVSFTP